MFNRKYVLNRINMAKEKKLVEAITSMEEDFTQWYTDVVTAAKLARYSNVKGCIIYEPNGTSIWEKIKEVLTTKKKNLRNTH